MSIFIFFVPLVAVVATLVTVLVAVPRRRAFVAVNEAAFPGLGRLRRSSVVTRLLALVLGLAAVVALGSTGELGRWLSLIPAAFAAAQIIGVLVSDVVAHNDARTPGAAGLEIRRVRDFLPQTLGRLTTLVTLALTVFLAWATAVASPDDLGRAGRSLSYVCSEDCSVGRFSPWPGSFYSVPMAIALLAVASLAGLTLSITVRRPRNGSDPEIVRVDDMVRRRSVESVVASLGIAVSASLAGIALFAGGALATSGQNHAPIALQLAGWVVVVAGLASVVLAVWCVVILLLPGGGAEHGEHLVPVGGLGRTEIPEGLSDSSSPRRRG